MTTIPCNICGQCNKKGKPSVMRESAYCNTHKKTKGQINRSKLFDRFKGFLFDRRSKISKDGKLEDVNAKGFRKSYFWR